MNFINRVLANGSNNKKIVLFAEEDLLNLQEAITEVVVVEDVGHIDHKMKIEGGKSLAQNYYLGRDLFSSKCL